jgi:hypothetical protein
VFDALKCIEKRRGRQDMHDTRGPVTHDRAVTMLQNSFEKIDHDGNFADTPMVIVVGNQHYKSVFISQKVVYYFDSLFHHTDFPSPILGAMQDLCDRTGRNLVPVNLLVQHDHHMCGVWPLLVEPIWYDWCHLSSRHIPFDVYMADILRTKYNITAGSAASEVHATNKAIREYRMALPITHGVNLASARARAIVYVQLARNLPRPPPMPPYEHLWDDDQLRSRDVLQPLPPKPQVTHFYSYGLLLQKCYFACRYRFLIK